MGGKLGGCRFLRRIDVYKRQEIEDVIGLEAHDAPLISAKNGVGIEEVLEQIVNKIPAPGGSADNPLQALIFDSLYDSYKEMCIRDRFQTYPTFIHHLQDKISIGRKAHKS